jgi:hypothetical protein
MMKKTYVFFALATPLVLAHQASARNTIVQGSISTGLDYWERSYDSDEAEEKSSGDKRQIGIWPEIVIVSEDIKDVLSFKYAPVLKYDDVDSETDVDHYLSLAGERLLTRNWKVMLSDNFRLSDDPYFSTEQYADTSSVSGQDSTEDTEAEQESENDNFDPALTNGDELSKDSGRSRYWTNSLFLQSQYTISERTGVGLGYGYSVLRNESADDDAYNEYDKHSFVGTLDHVFTQSWWTSFGLNYTRGLRDDVLDPVNGGYITDDLDQYGLNAQVDYKANSTSTIPVKYDYSATDFDNEYRRDLFAHNLSAGWEYEIDSRTSMALGGGPSYAEADGLDGEWGYNAYFDLARKYLHSSLSFSLLKKFETKNFTGTDNSGLKDTFLASLIYNNQFTQNLNWNVYGRYRWESNADPQDEYRSASSEEELDTEESLGDVTYEKNSYEVGTGLSYQFLRYYSVGVRYAYYVSDGDLDADQYNDHRVMLTLSAVKDLWRW